MGENNESSLLEEQQETAADRKKMSQFFNGLMDRPGWWSRPGAEQVKLKLSACLRPLRDLSQQYSQLAHYFSLLCFLLIIITLLQTFCLVQLTLVFQSQSAVQEAKEKDLTRRLEKLNQSYQLLFSQYPALNQYCPVSNSSSSERVCSPCPTGWTPQGQKCFLFSEDRSDWISGQYRCLTLGGVMATVRTEDEQVFLWRTAQSRSHGDSYWLGMRSGGGEEGWQWSDGSPVVKGPGFWQREPSGTDNRELCGRLTPGDNYRVSWFTSRCSSQMRRICERKQAALQ